jgi:hypothetical protein
MGSAPTECYPDAVRCIGCNGRSCHVLAPDGESGESRGRGLQLVDGPEPLADLSACRRSVPRIQRRRLRCSAASLTSATDSSTTIALEASPATRG